MAGDSGYEPTEEDMRLMDIYYAARDAGLSQSQAQQVQMQAAMEAAYAAPQVSVDTAGLTGAAPNIQGTPTVYYDAGGNVAGVLSQNGVVTPSSMNAILKPGEVPTVNTPVQMVDAEGVRLYLRDANDPQSVTYTNTGIPAIAGTLGESAYRPVEDRGPLGTIGSDFAGMAKDPAFWKFLASAAAITGGGLLANAAIGAPGSVATAFPVADAALLPATELGAAGAGTGATGASLGGGYAGAGAGEFIAADMAANAASQGFLPSLEALLPAGAMGSLIKGGLTLGGLAALSALAPKASTGGSSSTPTLNADQLKAIVSSMPSAMGQYVSMASNPYGYGGGTIDSANANLANLFPNFSLPTTGPFYGAGRFGDYYAPQAASTTPISPTGLV